jgi:hypothetical protein
MAQETVLKDGIRVAIARVVSPGTTSGVMDAARQTIIY